MPKNVRFLVFENVQSLDVTGPFEVFAAANKQEEGRLYDVRVLSPDGQAVQTSSGMRWEVDGGWSDVEPGAVVVVPGGTGVREHVNEKDVLVALSAAIARAETIASICTGAFLLGELGLLDGRRVTTHWERQDALADMCPKAVVERDLLYVIDDVWSSAGVTAGMDLALAMVERDGGFELAHQVAAWLVLSTRRRGDAPQVSEILKAQGTDNRGLARLQAYIANHCAHDLRVETLARRVGMSPRNFARQFQRDLRMTPAAYVRHVRLNRAKDLLSQGIASVDEVAAQSGFKSRQILRRLFQEAFQTTPSEYRRRQVEI